MSDTAYQPPVSAWEETVIMPSYPAPAPDPNPMFLDKRVNQGATGRVYPNAFTDRVTNDKVDKPYRAVFLENEYLQLMLFPELGGRIQAGRDKTNQYDFIYRQRVIKPALIGLIGSWISGGIEFNWPQHHRPSTHMPVDYAIEEHADGSRTVWLGEHEPMDRTKGMIGICLHPGKAYIEFKVQLYNRTPFAQSFLWWVNVGVHTHAQYQVFFPPDVTAVTDHSKRAMAHFPIAREAYYGADLKGVDISWPKNIAPAASYFAWESSKDFFGGYDHQRDAGIVHVANHHISPGKKMFTWGTADFARAWEQNLTDADGPYIELMAGVYTDNQPDFSWMQPYETKVFTQYWYPIQQIGPAKAANRRVAVNLTVQDGQVRLGVCATETLRGAQVRLAVLPPFRRFGRFGPPERVLWERTLDLAPGAPLVAECALPEKIAEKDLVLRVVAASGEELLAYTPIFPEDKPLPEPMTPAPPPDTLDSLEELYLTGVHVEQYKHPLLEPEPYWEKALRLDPGDVRSNNALGLAHLRCGNLALAEQHFRRAIQTWTRRNPNPRDGEPYYNLGLALKYQGRLDEAYAAFYKGIWSYAWQAAGYFALAEINAWQGDYATALENLDHALEANARNLKARDLKAAMLRRLDRLEEAEACARATVALDRLDYGARNELLLLAEARDAETEAIRLVQALGESMRSDGGVLEAQRYLDLACDYAAAGLWDEASDVLERLVDRKRAGQPVYPMVLYALGYYAHQKGAEEVARTYFRQAAQMPPDYCFPARLDEMLILQHVRTVAPDDGLAAYYLGNLQYDKKNYVEAIQNWEKAAHLRPAFSIPWRNLGVAYYNVQHDAQHALACYLRAFDANPRDARVLSELDQLLKRMGARPAERLARLEAHLDLVDERDDLTVERAALYNQLGQPQKALEIMLARQFHPWEGGEGRVGGQYVMAHTLLGRAALDAGKPAEALQRFEAACSYPASLGEGKYAGSSDAPLHYLAGLAREALGDVAGAQACSQQAAQPQRWLSPLSYYQALALRKLGDESGAQQRLVEMRDHALKELEAASQPGFSTSVPAFIFHEDAAKFSRIANTYLLGLAQLGLGQTVEARQSFQDVLALDVNHLGAQEELRSL
jgi:tetratricopeptide (TPR) repeat protein